MLHKVLATSLGMIECANPVAAEHGACISARYAEPPMNCRKAETFGRACPFKNDQHKGSSYVLEGPIPFKMSKPKKRVLGFPQIPFFFQDRFCFSPESLFNPTRKGVPAFCSMDNFI